MILHGLGEPPDLSLESAEILRKGEAGFGEIEMLANFLQLLLRNSVGQIRLQIAMCHWLYVVVCSVEV